MPGVPELSPTEFVERWPNYAGGGDVVLLDVREHVELELAAVACALHIPMREVPARLAEPRYAEAAGRDVPFGWPQPPSRRVLGREWFLQRF